jgi:hypothetical protein
MDTRHTRYIFQPKTSYKHATWPIDTALSIGVEVGANWQRGDTLPSLLTAQDVSRFHNIIQHLKSIDEAKDKKPIIEAEAQAPQQVDSTPS